MAIKFNDILLLGGVGILGFALLKRSNADEFSRESDTIVTPGSMPVQQGVLPVSQEEYENMYNISTPADSAIKPGSVSFVNVGGKAYTTQVTRKSSKGSIRAEITPIVKINKSGSGGKLIATPNTYTSLSPGMIRKMKEGGLI